MTSKHHTWDYKEMVKQLHTTDSNSVFTIMSSKVQASRPYPGHLGDRKSVV